ncbi:hypothetical protein PMALA_043060 [Plasmodium malariae]|uniref:Uncharacterized protein n=1 Tax=Plasmodium malariae TaxID=5858 RepID=A0A1A8WN61_PLAMA|nr:hypothetical protein PMALA_043060 [Plasmodium malariae]
MNYHKLKANLEEDESSNEGYDDLVNMDEEEVFFPNKKMNIIKSERNKKNGIPVKIKYIRDANNDENSKYVIEIPKKDLTQRGSKNHVKAGKI